MAASRRSKFTTMSADEITISHGISVPNHLKSVVVKAPPDEKEIGNYLTDLLKSGKITLDDVDFLIASGALI